MSGYNLFKLQTQLLFWTILLVGYCQLIHFLYNKLIFFHNPTHIMYPCKWSLYTICAIPIIQQTFSTCFKLHITKSCNTTVFTLVRTLNTSHHANMFIIPVPVCKVGGFWQDWYRAHFSVQLGNLMLKFILGNYIWNLNFTPKFPGFDFWGGEGDSFLDYWFN